MGSNASFHIRLLIKKFLELTGHVRHYERQVNTIVELLNLLHAFVDHASIWVHLIVPVGRWLYHRSRTAMVAVSKYVFVI